MNPFNGPIPTYAQAVATATQRSPFLTLPSVNSNLPYTHQANVGLQRQFGTAMSLAADFVYTNNKDVVGIMDVNLAYNPETGANYPFTDLTRRPVRGWGAVNQNVLQPNGPESMRAADGPDQADGQPLPAVGDLSAAVQLRESVRADQPGQGLPAPDDQSVAGRLHV